MTEDGEQYLEGFDYMDALKEVDEFTGEYIRFWNGPSLNAPENRIVCVYGFKMYDYGVFEDMSFDVIPPKQYTRQLREFCGLNQFTDVAPRYYEIYRGD